MPRKSTAFLAALLLAAGAAGAADAAKPFPKAARAGPPQFQDDAALASAVGGAWRVPTNRARDAARHPAESLIFWGVKPGATILEISPGGGYWTEIVAPYAKATGGRYIAAVSERGTPDFKAKYADAAVYGPVETVVFSKATNLGAPGTADVVFTARNIHSFMGQDNLDKVMADSFAVLKPGGDPGRGGAPRRPATDGRGRQATATSRRHTSSPRPSAPGSSSTPARTSTPTRRTPRTTPSASGPCRRPSGPRRRASPPIRRSTAPNTTQSARATG